MARLIEQVIGHHATWELLMRQFGNRQLPHAVGFVGPSGVGKKRVAWALAQALVCEVAEPQRAPCGECPACRRVENQQSESVLLIEPDKGMIKLESAHEVLQFLTLQRLGRARVVIVDSAQSMNPQATNSLLKAIEEPPPETFFIILIDELSQVLPTLRSRLQLVRFAPLSDDSLRMGQDVPEWMVRSSRGSRSRLESFQAEETEDLRGLIFEFISGSLEGRREIMPAVFERMKDREAALGAIRYLQQLLRDWTVMGDADVIHSDFKARLETLRPVGEAKRVELWRRAFQMELDFVAHVDKNLLFENFFYSAKAAQ